MLKIKQTDQRIPFFMCEWIIRSENVCDLSIEMDVDPETFQFNWLFQKQQGVVLTRDEREDSCPSWSSLS